MLTRHHDLFFYSSFAPSMKPELHSEVLVLLTFRVQQSGDPQLSFCHTEGLLQVLLVGLTVHLVHVDPGGPAGPTQTDPMVPPALQHFIGCQ